MHWQASPFHPFKTLLPRGEKVHVPHSELMSISPSGRIAHVWQKGDNWVYIDLFLITAIERSRSARGK
jgi:hypothetical protein